MAKPRVFISSTFYDLRQIRLDLDLFLENLGYEPVRNEEGDIPYGRIEKLEDYCYKEVQAIDILISIIGGRFGTESGQDKSSISQRELRTALENKKQVYIFIEKNVLAEYETYCRNKDKDINYCFVDDVRIYKFIEEIKGLKVNNNIKGFETSSDITKYLKEQFAGLFKRFLEQQTQIEEVNRIKELEKTAQNLNALVTYLSQQNQESKHDIDRILMINHPLITDLAKKLKIPYNFYVKSIDDLNKLLKARGYTRQEPSPFDDYYKWTNISNNGVKEVLSIIMTIFDSNGLLNYVSNTSWTDENVILTYESQDPNQEDDLPF